LRYPLKVKIAKFGGLKICSVVSLSTWSLSAHFMPVSTAFFNKRVFFAGYLQLFCIFSLFCDQLAKISPFLSWGAHAESLGVAI